MMIDCSTVLNPTSIHALMQAGVTQFGRYLRNMTVAEVQAIQAAGGQILSIAERGLPTSGAYFSASQGLADVGWAVSRAQALGQPAGSGIVFPVDYDAQAKDFPRLIAYYKAIRPRLSGYKLIGYGGYQTTEFLASQGLCDGYWQGSAWSYGRVSKRADIYQHNENSRLAGIVVDYDDVRRDIGFWPVKGVENVQQTKVYVNGKEYPAVVVNGDTYPIWQAFQNLPGFTKQFKDGAWHFSVSGPDNEQAKSLIAQGLKLL